MTTKCHFIGIGGIGMSGLARILLKQNIQVSGSDISSNYVTEGLVKAGAKVFVGHSPDNISPEMTVIYSTDIKKDNPEFQAALSMKCPMLHRSDLLLQLMHGYKTLAIAGTHGKTTTTALLTAVLSEADFDPCFAVGGILPNLQVNAGYGKGEYFVAEADESDGSFLKYSPWGAIVTNIDTDHMDYYKSDDKLKEAFKDFIGKVESSQNLFWCGDDARLVSLKPKGISYGFDKHCLLRATRFSQEGWSISFDANFKGRAYADIEVALTGRHNALNALAVFGLALSIGVPEQSIRKAFKNFHGVMRRCEKKGESQGVLFIDDYAHHPTEIMATLKALREAAGERRLIAVFQPHRYTRTQECLGTYGKIFDDADALFITDIFGAGETPISGLTSKCIAEEVKQHSTIPFMLVQRKDLAREIGTFLRPHDIVVGLGAGDITKLGPELLTYIKTNPVRKLKIGLIYGGRSVEHEVSLMSSRNVLKNLRTDFYEILQFGITRQGQWICGSDSFHALETNDKSADDENNKAPLSPEVIDSLNKCDALFPVLHGPDGEDGSFQGFFEILGKAYTGCDYRASAVCMDKALTRKIMILNGVPTPAFIDFGHTDWKEHSGSILAQIHQQLKAPFFIKAAHSGSNKGIQSADSIEKLQQAIEEAFLRDDHLLIESDMKNHLVRFAVLGNDRIKVFPPNRQDVAVPESHATQVNPEGILNKDLIEEGKLLAQNAYKAAGCSGMALVDCFLDNNGKFWLNEINPVPDFTESSIYPQNCQAQGLTTMDLVDKLIILGLERWRQHNRWVF